MKAYTNDTNGLLNKKLDDYLLSIKPTQQPKAVAASESYNAPPKADNKKVQSQESINNQTRAIKR